MRGTRISARQGEKAEYQASFQGMVTMTIAGRSAGRSRSSFRSTCVDV
jgi:hypothetical protein